MPRTNGTPGGHELRVPAREVVDDDRVDAGVEQGAHHVCADVAGAAGHEPGHGSRLAAMPFAARGSTRLAARRCTGFFGVSGMACGCSKSPGGGSTGFGPRLVHEWLLCDEQVVVSAEEDAVGDVGAAVVALRIR